MMIRTWHGCVPLEHAEDFAVHLDLTGVKHAQGVKGNKGASIRRVTQEGWEHFFLATWWQDIEAIKAFAGNDYHVAVTYPDDEKFCLLSDPYVFQHEVDVIHPL